MPEHNHGPQSHPDNVNDAGRFRPKVRTESVAKTSLNQTIVHADNQAWNGRPTAESTHLKCRTQNRSQHHVVTTEDRDSACQLCSVARRNRSHNLGLKYFEIACGIHRRCRPAGHGDNNDESERTDGQSYRRYSYSPGYGKAGHHRDIRHSLLLFSVCATRPMYNSLSGIGLTVGSNLPQ